VRKFTDEEVDKLIPLIKEQLSPDPLGIHGNFINKVHADNWHPDYREAMRKLEDCYELNIGTIVYQVTPKEYDCVITEEQMYRVAKVLNQVRGTAKFIAELDDYYNCYTWECIIYFANSVDSWGGPSWWVTISEDVLLPFNADISRDEELLDKLEKRLEIIKAKKGREIVSHRFRKVYKEAHYLPIEWEDLKMRCMTVNAHCAINNQPQRITEANWNKRDAKRKEDFRLITLQPTQRKIMLHVHRWGYQYVELQPIIK
jgi:hypothetical protein